VTAIEVEEETIDLAPEPARFEPEPRGEANSPQVRRGRTAWLTAALLFVVLRALPIFTYPLGRDQGTYLTMGKSLLQGSVLYRDLWDNKPPGIFYLYGLIGKLFGTRMWSAAAVDLLLLLLVSWCIFRFTERYLGPGAAAVAVAVHAVWHVEAGYIFTAQPEFVQIPLIFLAYFLVAGGYASSQSLFTGRLRRFAVSKMVPGWLNPSLDPRLRGGDTNPVQGRDAQCSHSRGGGNPRLLKPHFQLFARHLAAGLLLGVAFWFKYNALAFLPLLLVPCLDPEALNSRPPRLRFTLSFGRLVRRVAWILAGFALIFLAVLCYFGLHGALAAFEQIQFQVLPRYAAMAAERRRLPLGQWIAVRSEFFLGAATLGATLVALLIAWRRRDLARTAPLFAGAALAYAATASQLSFHSYYFATCYPFFAMIWAYLALVLWETSRAAARVFARRRWRLAQVLVWVLFANILYWPLPDELGRIHLDYESLREWRANPELFYTSHPWEIPFEHLGGQFQVIHYLRARSAPSDQVFLFGGHTLICYLSGRPCVTRFVSNLGLMSLWTPPAWRREVLDKLHKEPPNWIVVARHDALPSITFVNLSSDEYLARRYPALQSFIDERYRLAADFDTFVVYRRR
jgi:Dolichyl-phosphate-mannose-protein mannosyltransferase